MADVIRKTTNRFTKGLVMDFSPENTKNELLTNALNATLLTFNGNELSLQNDMGNGRVETAFLPEGYMPVGTCEYGGIIYIVSYNPLENKSQIGCFPSPERNISQDELGIEQQVLFKDLFQNFDSDGNPDASGLIKNNSQYVLLRNDPLNPGDKFIISANKEIYDEKLADLWVDKDNRYYQGSVDNPKEFELLKNPIIALNIVSIEDSGKIIYLNSTVRKYEGSKNYTFNDKQYTDTFQYHILGTMEQSDGVYNQKVDIDNYRNVLSSGYNVFKAKTSGKLAILAELIMIDSYSVTHSLQPQVDESGNTINGAFDVILHTEVEPKLNKDNYYISPKLQFYYLENSQGYLQTKDTIKELFINVKEDLSSKININFENTSLNSIYTVIPDSGLVLNEYLKDSGKFHFPRSYTYHGRMQDFQGALTDPRIYTKFAEGNYYRINKSQILNSIDYLENDLHAKFYFYDPSGQMYTEYDKNYINTTYTYYTRIQDPLYWDAKRDFKTHGNKKLYKMITIPLLADKNIINNIEIEKFQEQEVITYIEATVSDINSGKTLYYKVDDNTYVSLIGAPVEGQQYYITKSEETFVSIGYVVSAEEVSGSVYYYPDNKDYVEAPLEDIKKYWDFEAYPYTSTPPYGSPVTLYWQEPNWVYKEITHADAQEFLNQGNKIYYNSNYINIEYIREFVQNYQLFIVLPVDSFVSSAYFKPNPEYNYIHGYTKPAGTYPKDDKMYLYTIADFIPENVEYKSNFEYDSVKLASIKIPEKVANNGLDLPFKYEYTIVPCMNYGKLQHLAISNTIDFSKLHAFNQSKFTTWKYHISNNQLRLTFGSEVYDTYEEYKVDGLILEFYDCWGFAGSLEITDKKSYTGIFTKIIPLNSLEAISKRKISGSSYLENFKHNINISDTNSRGDSVLNLRDVPVSYSNASGWSVSSDDNDCGTLYSNVVYCVKAYMKRKVGNTLEFIHKQNFVLYTLPIYNDFYYSIQDFSSLESPQLDLVMTYKIKDSSTKQAYTSDNIINGYDNSDKSNLKTYLSGFYKQDSLNLTKYYKYSGCSELYLEIGLKKDYENLNLSCDSAINKVFTCDLQIISEDDQSKVFNINSSLEGLTSTEEILNYTDSSGLTLSTNKIGFNNNYSNKTTVSGIEFSNSNFITNQNPIPIKINYEFVVGYKALIENIDTTQVPATTVCALFHMTPSGEYNYSDFGIYEQIETDSYGNSKVFKLSDTMFYNEGTSDTEIFGICRQIITSGTLIEQCSSIFSVETAATEIRTAGKLNTGDPLKQMVSNIGKLAFCQPHVHGLSEVNGVNIHEGSDGGTIYGIPPEVSEDISGQGHGNDDTHGIVPRDFLHKNPKYNLCANTINSIKYNSEFISAIDYNTTSGKVYMATVNSDKPESKWSNKTYVMREYTGFTGEQVAAFNEKMLETMKYIYAYNPDYDSLTVNVGNISLQDHYPSFTTNLVSYKSSIAVSNLNDYIYLGPMKFSKYLKYLQDNFGQALNINMNQLQFIPNLTYCGGKDNYCLINTLTYNTPVPKEIEHELEFSASDSIIIKHHNGDNEFLTGFPNKKALYGYSENFGKMLQLDVSNYTIRNDGSLILKEEGPKEKQQSYINITENIHKAICENSYNFTYKFTNLSNETVSLDLNIDYISSPIAYDSTSFFVGNIMAYDDASMIGNVPLGAQIKISNNDHENYKYEALVTSIEFAYDAQLLNDKISLSGSHIPLDKQSFSTLDDLISSKNTQVTLVDYQGNKETDNNMNYWAFYDQYQAALYLNGHSIMSNSPQVATTDQNGMVNLQFQVYNTPMGNKPTYEGQHIIGLAKFKITKVNFVINQITKLDKISESFVSIPRTAKYSEINQSNKYRVLDMYKNAQLKESSITLNDLVYEPNVDGHRLFMRNNLYTYKNSLRGKIYYRFLNSGVAHKSWWYDNTKYLNNIYLYTGPCYTSDV